MKVCVIFTRPYMSVPFSLGVELLYEGKVDLVDLGLSAESDESKLALYSQLPEGINVVKFKRNFLFFLYGVLKKYDVIYINSDNILWANLLLLFKPFTKVIFFPAAFLKRPLLVCKSLRLSERVFSILSKALSWWFWSRVNIAVCWNRKESTEFIKYYPRVKNLTLPHPSHIFYSSRAQIIPKKRKILISYHGWSEFESAGFNSVVQFIINSLYAEFIIDIKLHPLWKGAVPFVGYSRLISGPFVIDLAKEYNFLIVDDSYMGVEAFFMGLFVVNYGAAEAGTHANSTFRHLQSNDPHQILAAILAVNDGWDKFQRANFMRIRNDHLIAKKDYLRFMTSD